MGSVERGVCQRLCARRSEIERWVQRTLKAVVAEIETKEGRAAVQEALRQHLAGAAKPADAVQRSLANLKEVSGILNTKAPQDAAGFKAWLQAIGQNVAEASSEGGFLGIGGVQVSDAEKATLADIQGSWYDGIIRRTVGRVQPSCWALPSAPLSRAAL